MFYIIIFFTFNTYIFFLTLKTIFIKTRAFLALFIFIILLSSYNPLLHFTIIIYISIFFTSFTFIIIFTSFTFIITFLTVFLINCHTILYCTHNFSKNSIFLTSLSILYYFYKFHTGIGIFSIPNFHPQNSHHYINNYFKNLCLAYIPSTNFHSRKKNICNHIINNFTIIFI